MNRNGSSLNIGLFALLFASLAIAQPPVQRMVNVNNEGVTGTTLNKLAKVTGAPSTAIVSGAGDTVGALGVVIAGAGTTGQATIQEAGQTSCVFDGATTAGHYIQISSSTAGDCHDAGATFPTSGGQVIGVVLSTNGGAGTYLIDMALRQSAISAGGTSPGGSTDDIQFNNAGGFGGGRCTMGSSQNITCTHASADLFGNLLGLRKQGTTGNATLPPTTGSELGSVTATGWNGTAFPTPQAALTAAANENWTGTANGTRWQIATVPNGTAATQWSWRLQDTGNEIHFPTAILQWPSAGDANSVANIDTGITRNSAGVAEINNGTSGTFRDLIVRDITVNSQVSGATQCAQIATTGKISGTGSPCPPAGNSVASTTPVTVNTNTTADQQLMELSLAAGYLNTLNQPFLFDGAGVYSTQTAQTPTITLKIKLCTVSGCGSGTVVTLISIVSTATIAAVSNNNWNLAIIGYTHTTGSSGNMEIHGPLAVDLGALTTTADSLFVDTNTAPSSTIDLTAALFVDFTLAFSTNGVTANTFTQRSGGVMPFAASAGGGGGGGTFPFTFVQEADQVNSSTTSFTVTFPQTTAASGNTAWLMCALDGSTVTFPAGWTVDINQVSGASGFARLAVLHKATASDTSATLTTGSAQPYSCKFFEITGSHTLGVSSLGGSANTQALTLPSITPAATSVVFAFATTVPNSAPGTPIFSQPPLNPNWKRIDGGSFNGRALLGFMSTIPASNVLTTPPQLGVQGTIFSNAGLAFGTFAIN